MAKNNKKPRGYFDKILFMDAETTGLKYNHYDPSEGFQSISWGLIVADMDTLKVLDELYVEIKWNGVDKWAKGAQRVHGMSKEYLEKNGVTEEEAVVKIGNFIMKHWGPEASIRVAGHNVGSFDLWFMRRLMSKFGLPFKTGNRHLDTYSVGITTLKTYNSDDLFEAVGLPTRDDHNALEDARYALEVVRRIRMLWDEFVEV